MRRLLVLCEGQTEETFVQRILAPHLHPFDISPIPTLLTTKKVKSGQIFRGGITSYERIRRDVLNLLQDTSAVRVTTLLDYYGLPADFPGKAQLQGQTPYERVIFLETRFANDIHHPRFLPYLSLHEFEAMLFAQAERIAEALGPAKVKKPFENLQEYASPEEINEGVNTHPSARIQQAFPAYRKRLHGPLIIERIGLPVIRAQCPHLNQWLQRLETL